jgi:hypothetical protein
MISLQSPVPHGMRGLSETPTKYLNVIIVLKDEIEMSMEIVIV